MEGNTVMELAGAGVERLRRAGVENPRLDAELLLAKAIGKDRYFLHVNPDYRLNERAAVEYFALVDRRAGGEPLQYLTGCQEFMGLEFHVNPAVLIPRPDTETLVEAVLDRLKGCRGDIKALDLGTGSGAIAISFAYYCRSLSVMAVDISPGALQIAAENAKRHGVAGRIEFVRGDLFSPLEGTGLKFDLVVSNPPYISEGEMQRLGREVLREPKSALYGGPHELCFYKRIAAEAPQFLKKGGLLAVEIGYDQAEAVKLILDQTGAYTGTEVARDLAGRDRVVLAEIVINGRGECDAGKA